VIIGRTVSIYSIQAREFRDEKAGHLWMRLAFLKSIQKPAFGIPLMDKAWNKIL
jgi:hypothetical protein